ncbi:MAG: zinc-ribbon domain-containing protein [Verrucomicrobiota bacterium]
MKTYACACGEPLYFENVQCVNCGRAVGFLPDLVCISSLEAPDGEGRYLADAPEAAGRLYRKCGNYLQTGVCNGMVPAENTGEAFCTSCRLNVVIPT